MGNCLFPKGHFCLETLNKARGTEYRSLPRGLNVPNYTYPDAVFNAFDVMGENSSDYQRGDQVGWLSDPFPRETMTCPVPSARMM